MKKKIKSLICGINRQYKITIGKNKVTNIVQHGEYPSPVEYKVYEIGRRNPRVISGLRIDKVEYYE